MSKGGSNISNNRYYRITDTVRELIKTHETRDPFRIAKELGALIVYVPLVRVNGFYQRYEDQDIIYINQDLGEDEAKLVCAHELGHLVLHNDINFIFLETTLTVSSVYEAEANLFAIQLLREDLNLNVEIPIINWNYSDIFIRRYIQKLEKELNIP